MSFGSGGFGGFGQNNNNNQSSGFGGFGASNNNATSGFGSGGTGFGQNNNTTGGTMFGGGNTTNTGGFGSSTGGFGANNTGGGFGSKPAFGASTSGTGGGMFGSSANNNSNTTGGFGGFGGATNTSNTFGGGNTTGGGMFGANKPSGFGTSTSNTGNSLFGGGASNTAATSGFGGGGGFGSANAGAVGDPPGTANTPFQAYNEKETNSSQTNAFQNILFQDPYKKWSAEELRLVDYAQGRRHGNASGAGAFGVSSGFGGSGFGTNTQQPAATTGFGSTPANNNTGGGLFGGGNNNTAGTGFGSTPAATSGFGSNANAGGGLFGANKPAGGGLFGGNTATNNTTTGGFGSTNTGGFGATNNATSGGGLFGQSQNKPQGSGFSFGNTGATTTPATGFGTSNSTGFGANNNTTTTGGGLFGGGANNNTQAAGGGLFGGANNTTQPSTGGGLFGGGNNAQPQQSAGTGFGSSFGGQQQQSGGLFGGGNAAQQKPAGGLFGTSTTPANNNAGGGLFGGGNTQQTGATGFGASTNTGGGLFGNKPATGGGLFGGGAAQTNNTGGGGLFGNSAGANTQQTTGGGLFGGAGQQQKPGGLFGNSTASTGGGMFGNQNNQNAGSSLFGGNNQQQNQQGGGLGGSLLGASQQTQNAPQGLTANLNDVSAYGTPALFAGLGGSEVADPGPLATPLGGSSKPRKSNILPLYKLAPASASRYATPQKRGFGFSYSSYGTPGGSPASISSTPGGLGRSLLGSSTGGSSLAKSMSTNNLRRAYNSEDSILAPGAFSSSNGARGWYGSTGSKKLIINREIRSDLFSTPQKDKQGSESARKLAKRVSFDTSNVEGEETTPVRGALPAPGDIAGPQADETPRQTRSMAAANEAKSPENEQLSGKELAIVREDEAAAANAVQTGNGFDNVPGDYWMSPSREEIQSMNRVQRQKIDGFTVGRDNVGSITFKIPVDISAIDLDDLCGNIIQLEPRSATVYPVSSKKPPVGKGLNVPARITLEQSWPRGGRDKRISSDPKRFNKHIDRLKRIPDTTFESYDQNTGVWVFGVEHFTTYGLDDSDDEETDADMDMETTRSPGVEDAIPEPVSFGASLDSQPADDTFMFQQRSGLPGAFDTQEEFYGEPNPRKESFLGISSADSVPNDVQLSLEGEYPLGMGEEYEMSDDEDLTRASLGQHQAAELDDISSEDDQDTKRGTPGGILRARMRAVKDSAGPVSLEVADGDDWAEMLRKTVSPVKRDRHILRELNESPSKVPGKLALAGDRQESPKKSALWGRSVAGNDKGDGFGASRMDADKGRGFATSIDLMNSLFEKPKPTTRENLRASVSAKGFPKWPYDRQDKALNVSDKEQAFHDVPRTAWGPDETFVVTRPLNTHQFRRPLRDNNDILNYQRSGIQTDGQDLRLAKFASQSSKKYLRAQDKLTNVRLEGGIPVASLKTTSIKEVFHHQDMNDPASIHENRVWELASILFDATNVTTDDPSYLQRKKNLSSFWAELVEPASSTAVGLAGSSEEKAVACLAGHRITEACKHLIDGKNFRLGTLVPLIGTSDSAKRDMKEQLKTWQESKMLSEFTEAIRTICELLSGNVCVCEGLKGVPVEDRMESFVISKKFGFDWRQAFGLRLWYALNQSDDPKKAVQKYQHDIEQDKEDIPAPWYIEQGLKPLWDDVDADSRQDLLWGLLQLYADPEADLEAILRPENSQLSPMDMRLCWQLGQALLSTGNVTYGDDETDKADAVTLAYATQLTGAGEWLEAVFVLLHLQDATSRKQALQEHLCRHGGSIGPDNGTNFTILTEKFLIPAEWLWEALALYMRSVKKDAPAEVNCLLRAGSFAEAHHVLVKQVAPQAVVERDYASLTSMITQFEGHEELIADWSVGGEIYGHFLTMLQHRSKKEGIPSALLERLLAGLNAMSQNSSETEIVRYAAISDMADETAREILRMAQKKQDIELRSRILHLPLTQDRLLAYSVDIGLDRFKEVMSH